MRKWFTHIMLSFALSFVFAATTLVGTSTIYSQEIFGSENILLAQAKKKTAKKKKKATKKKGKKKAPKKKAKKKKATKR